MSPREIQDTREHILEAAMRLFAKHGFEAASVRDICEAAKANVSAVKYHFGDKAGLYRACIASAAKTQMAELPMPQRMQFPTAEAALRAWVRWAVEFAVYGGTRRVAMTRILLREFREPSPVFDRLVREVGGPVRREIEMILAELIRDRGGGIDAGILANNVVTMCMQYEHLGELLTRLGYPAPSTSAELDAQGGLIAAMAMATVDTWCGPDAPNPPRHASAKVRRSSARKGAS